MQTQKKKILTLDNLLFEFFTSGLNWHDTETQICLDCFCFF